MKPKATYTHKSIYISVETSGIWDDAEKTAARRGVSLSTYVTEALAAHNGDESPAVLARRLSSLLGKRP